MSHAQAIHAHEKNDRNGEIAHDVEEVTASLKERAEQARETLEVVKEKAEAVMRERPYLVPAAAGAAGFAAGMFVGSKLMRFVVFTAVGAVLTETVGSEVKRLTRDFVGEMHRRLVEGEVEEEA